MNDDSSNTAAPLDEQLVAYLDGELDPESGRRIEARLATDPKLRRRLQSLERTWDLLDELDAAPAGELLTHTTLEMVAMAAREEVERDRDEAPRRRRRRLLAIAAALLAAASAGFAAVALMAPDPNRQLLEDLPLLERFDEYRHVESVEFLRQLRDEGLFPEKEADSSELSAGGVDYSPSARRRRVAGMSPGEKEQLRLVEERFNKLAPRERQRLRQLHEALRNDPDADRLLPIMRRYCEWLKTLSSYSRAGLAELEPTDRLKWIKKRLRRERLSKEGRLGGEDLRTLRKWVNEYAARHEAQFLETLSKTQRKRLLELSPPMRRWIVLRQMLQRWQAADSEKPLPMMTDEEMTRLRRRLSPRARKRLEAVSPALQWKMAAGWLRQGMRRPGTAQGERPVLTKADDERLAHFFEKELSPKQRDRLLGMPGEEMQRELHRLFLMRARSLKGPHLRPGGFNRGKWPPAEQPKPKKPPRK